ncbi:SPW repeat protein [Yinghuangia sp. ASG 101]|uniref:SPW repeat protein n=1 Tax=Yinghuangia sp. ASG 101 TaxID=2896848 RepID=UPI001E465FC5|nr:SPW repeat protein [Yinghuangia sp. ASG 101]UGQ12235.1 SPW repeat protein [Yinghuangia sp. ASG 101]
MATTQPIEHHPDLVELRDRYDRAAATPIVQGLEALAMITGVYLAASPWIVGFNGFTGLAISNLITGAALVLLVGGAAGNAYERSHARAWAAAAIGIWTIVAPWAISGHFHNTRSITSNVVTGAVAVVCALALSMAMRARGKTRARRF